MSKESLNTQLRESIKLVDSERDEKVELIKKMVAKDCTDDELQLFLYTAKRTGLDPLARQIYAVKRSGRMTIQTGIDGYRLIADRTGKLAGISDYIFDSEDAKYPNRATVTVKKQLAGGVIAEFTATARWGEYNAGGPMWLKMPFLMLGKCAEALALRKAFPADLSGVYTAEEMQQADSSKDREDVYAEVERQKAGIAPSEELTMKVLEGTTKARPLIYDDGAVLCWPLDSALKTTKDNRKFYAVKLPGKIEGTDMLFCWHVSMFDPLVNAKGKECQFRVEPSGQYLNIEEVISVGGVKFNPDSELIGDGDLPMAMFEEEVNA